MPIRSQKIKSHKKKILDNKIRDETVVDKVFAKMPALRVLYFQGNSAIKKIKYYRKTMIVKIKKLSYLDDRPVFKEDRRFAEVIYHIFRPV